MANPPEVRAGERPPCGREPLVEAITSFLAHGRAAGLSEIRASLEQTIDAAGQDAVHTLSDRLTSPLSDWSYYPGDPLARRIHHVLAGRVLRQAPVVTGAAHLASFGERPTVIVANHLSYSDANAIDVLLEQAGLEDIARRLTVMAGPKVYSNLRRRFSSLCFGTIRTPQNSGRASEEAVMSPRDVALAARRTMEAARDRLRLGEVLLVFAEGTRSRSSAMQPLLPAAARYFDWPGTWVVPVALTGTERLFPMDETGVESAPIRLGIGRPIPADVLASRARGDRRLMMDCVGFAIAAMLPSGYRGTYAVAGCEASDLARELFAVPEGSRHGSPS